MSNITEQDIINASIKAFEKQFPKEVTIRKYRNDYDWTCNSCNTTFNYIRYTDYKANYCSNCGQALKWNIEDEEQEQERTLTF